MRFTHLQSLLFLLLGSLLLVRALEDVPAPMQNIPSDPTQDRAGKPKLMRPRQGLHKDDVQVEEGSQKAKADEAILENAEDNQPEGERVVQSLDDLSADDLLAMLHAAYRGHDEL